MRAWVVRGGSMGQYESANLAENVVTIDWNECGDLTPCRSRDDVRDRVNQAYPNDHVQRRAVNAGQIWAFRSLIAPGDIVIMPLKSRPGFLAFGRCAGDYAFDPTISDVERRNKLPVEWQEEAVSKAGIKDDLLNTLNSIMTVFQPSRNNAVRRLQQVLDSGIDPGNGWSLGSAGSTTQPLDCSSGNSVADEWLIDPDPVPTVDAIQDRIRTHVIENFAGHKLTGLVADVLEVLGYKCEVSPPGPDGGVDIVAGTGPLGLNSPTLIVEVKSEPTKVGASVLRGLHSAMTQNRADQALLVAWGGVTAPASKEFATQRTSIRVWESEDLLEKLFETYDRLPAETRRSIPLERVWVLHSEDD